MRERQYVAFCGLLMVLASIAPTAGFAIELSADSQQLWSQVRAVPVGGALHLQGLDLGGDDDGAPQFDTLVLERFRVFTADARIVVHGADGDRLARVPKNAYFHGHVTGEPQSVAWLTALDRGGLRGLIADRGAYWVMATGSGENPLLTVRRVDSSELADQAAGFECGGARHAPDELFDLLQRPEWARAATELRAAASPPAGKGGAVSYTARIAVETDFEFWQKFGNAADAADYVGDLIGYSSTIYSDEIDTSLQVSSISFWETSSDPWEQSPGLCALFEFGRFWNLNRDEERTIAHFLSGKSANVGAGWVGVLCRAPFSYNHGGGCNLAPDTDVYGGDYGFSGGIDGNFDIGNPNLIWDLLVVLHEIGHNFSSPHSHCYENNGGNSEPVDQCYAGQCGTTNCYCGPTSLPCSGSGCGTIMSYCHFLPGGISNISMTFGTGHPWGVEPERIPARMNAHVVSRADANPGCLDPAAETLEIFLDNLERGDTSAWPTSQQ